MSTRCCIKVVHKFGDITKECLLYHHHDGYPEGVGVDLVNRSKSWSTAYMTPKKTWDMDDIVNSLIKDTNDEYEYTVFNHTDIEYLYTIDCNDMTIKCNKCQWIFEDENGNVVDENKVGDEVPIPQEAI